MAENPQDNEQYRGVVDDIIRRAEQDEAFSSEAKADPVGTLVTAGVPEESARQMLSGYRPPEGEEVVGFRQCVDATCWSSACPGTCSVTFQDDTSGGHTW